MNNIEIRHANSQDIDAILELIIQLGYSNSKAEFEKRFQYYIENLDYGIAVAIISDKVVGWIAWSKTVIFVSGKTRFHIEGLIVDENNHGAGIGKSLMEFVENMAKQNNPSVIDLVSGVRRAPSGTHKFYDKLGYKNEGPMAKIYLRKEFD